jgi:bifunctional DNA-binding transcriptional regulator/antitoxin component of YhaV-PrlF toxin-antitoxin module
MEKIKEYVVRDNGGGSILVALPKVWKTDLGLKKGDVLAFYRDGDDLIIKPAKKAAPSGRGA